MLDPVFLFALPTTAVIYGQAPKCKWKEKDRFWKRRSKLEAIKRGAIWTTQVNWCVTDTRQKHFSWSLTRSSGVGGGGAGSASATPKVLICWKSGQNP